MNRCTSCGKRIWSIAVRSIHPYCHLERELFRIESAALEGKLAGESALKILQPPTKPQLPADAAEALTQLREALHVRMEWMRGETSDTDLARGWNSATALMLDDIDRLLNNRRPWIWKQGDKQK